VPEIDRKAASVESISARLPGECFPVKASLNRFAITLLPFVVTVGGHLVRRAHDNDAIAHRVAPRTRLPSQGAMDNSPASVGLNADHFEGAAVGVAAKETNQFWF
jgi:hypothetical protein